MAHINRKFIDKHWFMFIIRGILSGAFGLIALFSNMVNISNLITIVSVFLLLMGVIDAVGALYNSTKKHGWLNSIIDAAIDITAALALLFFAKNDLVSSVLILSIYTLISGIIDIFHGFISTIDPTDRFTRILVGVFGCVIGIVILNAGDFEVSTFIRFFGAYMLIVGATSMIYGVHNHAQIIEDKIARKEARKKSTKKRK